MRDATSGWQVQPLQHMAATVPLTYRVEAVTEAQVSTVLDVGALLLIDPDTGLVRNEHGTELFRLAYVPARGDSEAV